MTQSDIEEKIRLEEKNLRAMKKRERLFTFHSFDSVSNILPFIEDAAECPESFFEFEEEYGDVVCNVYHLVPMFTEEEVEKEIEEYRNYLLGLSN